MMTPSVERQKKILYGGIASNVRNSILATAKPPKIPNGILYARRLMPPAPRSKRTKVEKDKNDKKRVIHFWRVVPPN